MNPPASFIEPTVRVPASLGRKALLLISALLTFASLPARAEVLLSEAFSYPDGPLGSAPATQWQTQEGTAGQIEVAGGKLALKAGGFEVVSALLAGRPHAAGTLYAGFTVRFFDLPSGVSHFAAFNAENGLRNLGRLYATTEGAAPGYLRIGLSTFMNPLNNTVPVDLSPYQEFRVVLRYEPQSLGVTVWVNPVTEAEGGVQPQEDFSTFPSPISSLVFRQNPDTGDGRLTMMVDNLVVATTFAEAKDAPPEFIWEHTVQNGSATITRYLGGTGPEVVMPETLGGVPVRSFLPGTFQFRLPPGANLTLPSGITNISLGEFINQSLANVTFLGPIRAIPDGAFANCYSLVSVTYPDTLTSIGDNAFQSCRELRDISLPAGLTKIGSFAFVSCSSLKRSQGGLTIPASVTVIGDGAFRGCASLEAIEVEPLNTAFTSSDGVLLNKAQTILITCPAAKSGEVVIPESVTKIGNAAFSGCKRLTRLDLPSGLTSLGSSVFAYTGLTNVSLPAGVRTIPESAYQGCSGLVTVTLPEQITRVDAYAFADCDNLTEITIPRTVSVLGAGFASGASLTRINVDELNPGYSSVDGVVFNNGRTTLLAYPAAKPGNYQIPDGVRVIGVTAFAGATVTSVTIPASVTSLQERAFEFCPQLTAVVIPDTVTSLGVACFQFCDQLTSVRIGRRITTLPSNAFHSCANLSSVHLPDTLRTISDSAFARCLVLRSIVIPASVRTLGVGVFEPEFFSEDPVGLASIYFEGNAPTAGSQSLVLQTFGNGPTVYYRAGTTGWKAEFAGRPTVLWDPQVATGKGAPGIRDGKFGFTITGAAGLSVAVEACTDLADPVWVPLGTQVLTDGKSPFVDTDGGNHPGRYYRFQFP